ncbi:MAG: hypothetical protein KDD55_13165 [Bdellovibrionales bacterium]|nr:hypothetical protein [Bdellovibrionales bacterium]
MKFFVGHKTSFTGDIPVMMKIASPLLLASVAAFGSSCADQDFSSFSSEDLANHTLSTQISEKEPVVILMDDGNLMCVTEVDLLPRFFKTSSGYAEAGMEGSLVVVNGGVDYSTACEYTELHPLEALAFFNYESERISDPVFEQARNMDNSVNPELVREELELWSKGLAPEEPGGEWSQFSGMTLARSIALGHTIWVKDDSFTYHYEYVGPDSFAPHPVYLLMPTEGMLKITEDTSGEIEFFKSASGYGVAGGKVNVVGFGVGAERAVANLYVEISAAEVRAYFGEGVTQIIDRAKRQSQALFHSVDPDSLSEILLPNGLR